MSLYTLDFRHFFHEVGVSENLSRYFGVCIDGNYYRWRTMPMGFAFSPFCAKSIAWAAILYATIKDGEEEDPDFIIRVGPVGKELDPKRTGRFHRTRTVAKISLSHHYPRSGTAPIIKLLRRMITNENGKGMLDPRKWDARDFQLDTDEEKLAREAWTDVLSNPPHHYDDIPHPSHHIVVATDSSDHGYGYVMYDSEGNVIEEIARTWDVEFPGWKSQPPTQSFKWSERHIYLKELKAAIDFLSELSGRFPNTVFDIGIDNTAAMAAIKNIYSGSYEACEWLDAFHEKLQGNHCIVSAWGVRSEDNALDPSSRQCYDPTNSVHTCKDKGLAKRCWNHIQAQKKGYHPGPREGARPYAGGAVGIRHEEVLDLDDVGPGEIVEKIHMLSK